MEIKENDIIKVQVTGIEKYGIFVIEETGYKGLIHISEISESFVKNIKDYIKEDEIIVAKVIGINPENKQLKLSIKDIDYRINKKNKSKIVETKNGFSTLRDNLNPWIQMKKAEINTEKQKN